MSPKSKKIYEPILKNAILRLLPYKVGSVIRWKITKQSTFLKQLNVKMQYSWLSCGRFDKKNILCVSEFSLFASGWAKNLFFL